MKLQKTYLFLAGFVAILALPFFFSGPRAIASSIGSAAYSLIENAGSALTQRSILNFTGAGVSCADDAANSRTTCTVSGSGSGTINAGTVNQTAYYSGTTAISGAGPGASGQCWVSNGSGSPPSFQNCPSGSGVLTYSGPSLTFSGTLYFPVGGGALSSATEANVDVGSPAAATISNYYVQLSSAPGTGESIVFTWRKNGSSTSVTCTISGASATSCNDTTHTATFAAGDLMDIQTVTTGSPIIGNTVVMATQYGTGGGGGGGNLVTSGTWSSMSATPASSEYYDVTDAPGLHGLYNSGWNFYYTGCQIFPPVNNSAYTSAPAFAWLNQGSASVTNFGAFTLLAGPTVGSDSIRGREIAIPSSPFNITVAFLPTLGNQFQSTGLYFRDNASPAKLVVFVYLQDSSHNTGYGVGHYNSTTSFSTWAREAGNYQQPQIPVMMNINFTSGTATFSVSNNCGQSFNTFYSESTTAFTATPTNIGFMIDPNSSLTGLPNTEQYLLSWQQH